MKSGICIVAVSLLAGAAMAQQSGAPASQQTQTGQTPVAEMKTQTYKGQLVDLGCGSGPGSATGADRSATAASAGGQSGSCSVTANSSKFGLKTSDGRVLPFDLVGNQRAQDALKNNKKWTKDLSDGKPLNVSVQGATAGAKLIVSSIR
jgi:hypothetical protein